MALPLLTCIALAASFYGLPPRVLVAIHAVEGGAIGTVSVNRDGSQDLGPMQVNTLWIPALARYSGLSEPVVRERLTWNDCLSATAASVILKTYLTEARGDIMTAIGYYHSHTPVRGQSYRLRVVAAATRLFGPGPTQPSSAHP